MERISCLERLRSYLDKFFLGHPPLARLALVQNHLATVIEHGRHRTRPPHIRKTSQLDKLRLNDLLLGLLDKKDTQRADVWPDAAA